MFGLKVVLSLLWGIPWVAAGLLLGATIIGIPLGVLCIVFAGIPLAVTVRKRINDHVEWQHRDHPLYDDNEVEKPWEM